MVMAGYWNKPGQTAQVLRDGWMHTGDGGMMDEGGFVHEVDRLKGRAFRTAPELRRSGSHGQVQTLARRISWPES